VSRFDWKALRDWRQRLFAAFPEDLPLSLLEIARSHDPERFYSDDLTWIERIQADAGVEAEPDLDLRIASALGETFSSIRTYHACRPLDVDECLAGGLSFRLPEELQEIAVTCFGELGVSRSEVEAVHDDRSLGDEQGRLFLSLDDRDFTEYCGHYLIYGSEYLQAIAAGLHARYGPRPRRLLRNRGIPTVFEVDLPVSMVGEDALAEFTRNLLSTAFTSYCNELDVAPKIDFTFTLSARLPAEHIIGHYHPPRIRDPHEAFSEYRPEERSCPRCA